MMSARLKATKFQIYHRQEDGEGQDHISMHTSSSHNKSANGQKTVQ